jgi:hypothetical protein
MTNNDTVLDPNDLQPPVEPTRSPVRFNAVKHGILSVSPVIPYFENEDDWEDFRNSIFEELAPEGGLQSALADRVASLLWRLMRAVRFEREVVTAAIMKVGSDLQTADSYLRNPQQAMTEQLKERMDHMALSRLLPDDRDLNKLLRYEGRLHRHLLQTIHQIKLLKGIGSLPTGSSLGQPNVDAPATRLFGPESGAAGYNGGTPHT